MEIRKETENVIAIADDVLSSIYSHVGMSTKSLKECCHGVNFETLLNNSLVTSPGNDKSVQTEPLKCTVGIQGVSSNEVAVQCFVPCFNQMTQAEVITMQSQTQTDPDGLCEFIGAAMAEKTKYISTRCTQIDEKLVSLANRLSPSESKVQCLTSEVESLVSSQKILKLQLKDAELQIELRTMENLEFERRRILFLEEQGDWCDMILGAKLDIMKFYRVSEDAFAFTRNELMDKLDEIEILNNKIKSQKGENIIASSSITVDDLDSASKSVPCASDEGDEASSEIQKLLTDCWVVLREDM